MEFLLKLVFETHPTSTRPVRPPHFSSLYFKYNDATTFQIRPSLYSVSTEKKVLFSLNKDDSKLFAQISKQQRSFQEFGALTYQVTNLHINVSMNVFFFSIWFSRLTCFQGAMMHIQRKLGIYFHFLSSTLLSKWPWPGIPLCSFKEHMLYQALCTHIKLCFWFYQSRMVYAVHQKDNTIDCREVVFPHSSCFEHTGRETFG